LAAARLLSQHAALFATFIYDDYQQLVKLLWDATQHTNRDVKRKATSALEAVAGQLSLKLCEHKNDAMTRELFDSFTRWGQQTVQASSASTATTVLDSSVSRRALSVRLLGRLSQALLAYLGYPAYRQFVFTQLNYFDRLFTGPSDLVETCMPHLSHLIASYANFIKFLDLKVEATALGGIVENIVLIFSIFFIFSISCVSLLCWVRLHVYYCCIREFTLPGARTFIPRCFAFWLCCKPVKLFDLL
jgi:hypothetical protein